MTPRLRCTCHPSESESWFVYRTPHPASRRIAARLATTLESELPVDGAHLLRHALSRASSVESLDQPLAQAQSDCHPGDTLLYSGRGGGTRVTR